MIFAVCGAARFEFSLSDVSGEGRWGGVRRGREWGDGRGGDSGLKVKNLERMPRLGVNLKPESSVRVGRLSREQHFSYWAGGAGPKWEVTAYSFHSLFFFRSFLKAPLNDERSVDLWGSQWFRHVEMAQQLSLAGLFPHEHSFSWGLISLCIPLAGWIPC